MLLLMLLLRCKSFVRGLEDAERVLRSTGCNYVSRLDSEDVHDTVANEKASR